jgi:hypothetical protein
MLDAIAPEVQVAALSAAGLVFATAVGTFGEIIRRQAKATRQAVGEPNGAGNVVEMLERILAGQTGQDNRIARLEGGQHQIREDVARLTGRVDVLEHK